MYMLMEYDTWIYIGNSDRKLFIFEGAAHFVVQVGGDLLATRWWVQIEIFPSLAPSDTKSRGDFFFRRGMTPLAAKFRGEFIFNFRGNPAALSANGERCSKDACKKCCLSK